MSTIANDLDLDRGLPPVEVITEEKPLKDWETCKLELPKETIGVGILNPNYIGVARDVANTMAERADVSRPAINQVRVFEDGNLTIAIINNETTGWSKFNPSDVVTVKGKSKKGKIWYQNRSKYSPEAGKVKAIHRAVEKLINPLKEARDKNAGQIGQ